MSQATKPHSAEAAPASGGKSSSLTVAKVGGFIAALLITECVIAFMLLPSSQDVKAMAEARQAESHGHAASSDHSEDSGGHDHAGPTAETPVEVDLEKYCVTAYQPMSHTTLRVDFHLYGTVLAANEEDFYHRYESTRQRIREQVIVIVRSSELNDITDPGLLLLKRKILEKVNQLLGKPLVKTVVVSDFVFIEQ